MKFKVLFEISSCFPGMSQTSPAVSDLYSIPACTDFAGYSFYHLDFFTGLHNMVQMIIYCYILFVVPAFSLKKCK